MDSYSVVPASIFNALGFLNMLAQGIVPPNCAEQAQEHVNAIGDWIKREGLILP